MIKVMFVKFLRSLLDPEQFGYAVSQEVRQEAKRLLTELEKGMA
jgi:hypothetical protein